MDTLTVYLNTFLLLLINVVITETVNNNNNEKTCVNEFTDVAGVPINVTEYCIEKCIPKCCPEYEILYTDVLFETKCLKSADVLTKINGFSLEFNYRNIDVYKSNIEEKVEKSDLNLAYDFTFILNNKLWNSDCDQVYRMALDSEIFLLENSKLVMHRPNNYIRWVQYAEMQDFCLDYEVLNNGGNITGPSLAVRVYRDQSLYRSKGIIDDNYIAVAMLISVIFLLLLLFVYSVIRELRNLAGIVLMSYVASLAATFILQAIIKLSLITASYQLEPTCIILYFLILSTFCWMTVMSFDIWWSFRTLAHARPLNHHEELAKFAWFGLFAWGLPLVATVIAVVIDHTEIEHLPNIYKPFFENGFVLDEMGNVEIRYYLYMPCLALIIINWIFFLMTAYEMCRMNSRMTESTVQSAYHRNHKIRFYLYIQLAIVMGLCWLLEVIPLPAWLEAFGAIFNCLSGVIVFFIFVFKWKILYKLLKRFNIRSSLTSRLQRKYSSSTASNGCTQTAVRQYALINQQL